MAAQKVYCYRRRHSHYTDCGTVFFNITIQERIMFCIYLALAFFAAGIGVWIAGSIADKKKKKLTKLKRKKYQQLADKLGTAARIIFILCAVFFIFGFILLLGSQSSNMQPI
jgi:MFS family permease